MSDQKKKFGIHKIVFVAAILAIVFVIAHRLGLIESLKNVRDLQSWFHGQGYLGYVLYILLYILVAVFMFPASAITIAAGITFGSVTGGILALTGSTIGAAVAFVVARYAARDVIINKFGSNPVFRRIENGVKENGIQFLILTRLVPLFPYNIQNYAYGVTPMRLPVFVLVSLVTMAPGAFIYAFMAGEIAANGFSAKLAIQFAFAGLILFTVSLIPKFIAKKKGIAITPDHPSLN